MSEPISSVSNNATPAFTSGAPEADDVSSYRTEAKTKLWKSGSDEGGMTFDDFLDIINPLQHIPIISTIYRAITGDKIGLAAQLAGDTLYGGPIGFLASGLGAAFSSTAGKSDGEMLASVVHDIFGSDGTTSDQEASARGNPPASPAAAASAPAETIVAAPQASIAPASDMTPSDTTTPDAAPPDTTPLTVSPVTASPASAAPGLFSPATRDSHAAADPVSQRIAKQVAEAQRAQAGLLLASLQAVPAGGPARPRPHDKRDEQTATADAPAPPRHPFLPPPGGTPGWTNESMAQMLERYESAVRGQPVLDPARSP